nr:MAG TPA: hypothetical protein [Caudoviricetes sp.]
MIIWGIPIPNSPHIYNNNLAQIATTQKINKNICKFC